MDAYVLDELVEFSSEGHRKRIFFERRKIKAQVVGLEPGQQIPPCRMDHDVMFVVLDGEGKIIVDEEEQAIKKHPGFLSPKKRRLAQR